MAEQRTLSPLVMPYEVTLAIRCVVSGCDEGGAQRAAMAGVSFSLPMSAGVKDVGISSKPAEESGIIQLRTH
jgi:hypothetical protein